MRLLDLLMLVEAGKGHVTSTTKVRLFVSRSIFQPMGQTVKSCNGIDVCNRLIQKVFNVDSFSTVVVTKTNLLESKIQYQIQVCTNCGSLTMNQKYM